MTSFNILGLTGEQIRAARALSRIEQADLARRAGLSIETIKRLERIRGAVEANARTLRAIQDAFETLGVQFSGDQAGRIGVARRAPEVSDPHSLQGQGRTSDTPVHRLIYHSRIRRDDKSSLRSTLAHINNEAENLYSDHALTGALLAREGWLLQALEGDQDRVHKAFRAISSYREHDNLRLLDDAPVARRAYSGFTFCCGRFESDLDPAHTIDPSSSRITPLSAAALLEHACALQLGPPRNRRGAPGVCALADACLDTTCGSRDRASSSQIAPQAAY